MNTPSSAVRARGLIVLFLLSTTSAHGVSLVVETNPPITELKLLPPGGVFHTTTATVTESALIEVPNSTTLLMHWKETVGAGSPVPYYAFSFDNGANVSRVRRTSYTFKLGGDEFDPLVISQPEVPVSIRSDTDTNLYVVQFFTQPLEDLRQGVETLGATVHGFLPPNSRIVEMDASTKTQVDALAYVRWVGPFHPAYRLESYLRDNLDDAEQLFPLQRYNIRVLQPGLTQKNAVGNGITSAGGTVELLTQNGFVMQATLTPTQLLQVIRYDEVGFVGRWSEPSLGMDNARKIGGARFVEEVGGFAGKGVIAEVMDGSIHSSHPAFQSNPVTLHGTLGAQPNHGTNVYGIIFGDGTGAAEPYLGEGAKGILFEGQGVFASICRMFGTCNPPLSSDFDRWCHTCELVRDVSDCTCDPDPGTGECRGPCPIDYTVDPNTPFNTVFQSNSWGTVATTVEYDEVSRDLDDIIFEYDLLACHIQGNLGTNYSRSQAWSKNSVSIGGVWHKNSLGKDDDVWFNGASHGYACGGRVKPDLIHFYDSVYTTTSNSSYTTNFGQTSAATPIACAHFGVFFQMWHEGAFWVCDDAGCSASGGGASVFDSRSHMTTAKAIIINTAASYEWYGIDPPHSADLTRDKQGWGLPDVGRLYLLRNGYPVIVDETKVLSETEDAQYVFTVAPNTPALKATLVYADPGGAECPTPGTSSVVNDLDLKVTFTDGQQNDTVFWGNCNLMDSNWVKATDCDSQTKVCCGPNQPYLASADTVVDTVENVFIENPAAGTWTVSVYASEVNEDGHTETPGLDVDFALVVSVETDCDTNGIPDSNEILDETAADDDANGILDTCQNLIYVNEVAAAGGDGTNWSTAYNDLQTAIDSTARGDSLWVAKGDYGPITLKNEVAIYGGFLSGATFLSESKPYANVTNIFGDAVAKHVVESIDNVNTTVLRGFHIANGNANGTGNDGQGGALFLENSSAKFVQCVFYDNDAAEAGGAVANVKDGDNHAGSPTFVNCKFHRNGNAPDATLMGGAVYTQGGNPEFHNCLFHHNESGKGGAVYVEAGAPTLTNCTIAFNDADDGSSTGQGGGIWDGSGTAVVHNSIFFFDDVHGGSGQEIYNSGTPITCVSYSNVLGGWPGCEADNINVPARFTNPGADDYTLRSTSLCIDAGCNSYLPKDVADLDWNNDRTEVLPKDLNTPASDDDRNDVCGLQVDMGAYEFHDYTACQ